MNYQNPNSYNNPNPPFFSPHLNQQPTSQPMHSYADYRTSSALPTGNSYPSMYPPSRTFDEFGLSSIANNSSNSYNPTTVNQTSWHGGSRNPNPNMNNRGRRGGHGHNSNSAHKQATPPFFYSSSSSNNNNHQQNAPTRGRGVGQTFTHRY